MPRIGLFATCLVDLMRPSVGFAAVNLLRLAGAAPDVPSQTCCGQPAYNSGDREGAKAVAATTIRAFSRFDYVVVPSGSCAAMIRCHYPALFRDDGALAAAAQALAAKTYELTQFLTEIMRLDRVPATFRGRVAYHDSCSGLRELGVKSAPRRLLGTVEGLQLVELPGAETCCGFGGLFCIKYPAIADQMAGAKQAEITASGADTLLAGDLGCLMHMAGTLSRAGQTVAVRHVAEVLAGMTDELPPIGQSRA
jgi:L-lactate dehydrogenase complex protein LldE